MENQKISLLVMGIGNYLMGDEGIGIHAIHKLQQENFPSSVQLLDGGVGSFYLLEYMHLAEQLIIIDAANDGKEPGTITKLFPKFSSDYPKSLTAHDIGLKDLLDAFYISGKTLPEILLITVTIKSLPEQLSIELSPELKKVLPLLCEEVRKEIYKRIQY